MRALFARHPATRQWPLYSMAFRARAVQENVTGEKLVTLGREWVASAGNDHYQKISSMASVVAVLAEKKLLLNEAEALADDALKSVAAIQPDSVLGRARGRKRKSGSSIF